MNIIARLMLVAFLLTSFSVNAITIMEINTEFLWDDDGENEGRVVKDEITTKEYQKEVEYWAYLIKDNDADIVGLVEIEGCHVAQDISNALGNDWGAACKKGRDHVTGQDVAIITKMAFSNVDNFSSYYSKNGTKKVKPSKVLGVTLKDGNQEYYVVAAHLISMRHDNDLKRLHQAKAIVKAIEAEKGEADHIIVLGDLNALKGTPPVEELLSYGLHDPSDKHDCSYMYKNVCNLIDYILVSDGLIGGSFEDISIPEQFSDHQSVIYMVETK